MTTYYEPITLNNLCEIQNKFIGYLNYYTSDKSHRMFVLNVEEIEWLNENLAEQVSRHVKKEVKVSYGFLTLVAPKAAGTIHIDSNTLNPPKDKNNWAVNIPIYNCSQGIMSWYGGIPKVVLHDIPGGLPYTSIENPQELYLVDEKVVDQPTIVRINAPHKAVNNLDDIRILLTVRFDPDLYSITY